MNKQSVSFFNIIIFIIKIFCIGMIICNDAAGETEKNLFEIDKQNIQKLFTQEERVWLSNHKTIRIAGPKAFPPFHYYEENGALKGMASDYIDLIFSCLDIQPDIQSNLEWANVLKDAEEKKIDLISCSAKTIEREAYLNFSEPYLSFPLVIITKTDSSFIGGVNDLHGKKVAFIKGNATFDWIRHDKIETIPYIVKTPIEGLKAVSLGNAEAHIENLATSSYLIQKHGLANLKIAAPAFNENYNLYIAVRKDWPELISIINKTLTAITPHQHSQIRNRWLSLQYNYGIRKAEVIKWILGITCFFISIFAVILIWNRRLRKEIYKRKQAEAVIKTKSEELEAANKELIAATEDLQAKKQSLLNEKIFAEALLECLPGYLYVYDDQGNLVRWNKKHETMTGYSAEELSHKNMSDWFEGEDAVRVAMAVDEVLKTGYGEVEAHLLIKSGEKLFIHSNGVKLTLDGKTYFVGVGIDITERKRAENNLRESEARQGKMVANIGDVIAIIDQDGINRYKSPNIEKLFGWKPEDVVGASTWEIIHPDDIESTQKFFKEILSEPEAVGTMECRYRCKDGSYKWIEFTGTNFLRDPDINGVLGNYHDITERKKMQTQVQQAQKMESIGTLAGGIAHDFNNILFPIIGYTEIILMDTPEDSPIRNSINQIYTSVLRAKDLVKQILTFSRQESNELTLMKMQPIIKEALKLIRSSIPTTIEIKQDINDDCGAIKGDPTQIHQVIMNLTTNAYHAMEDAGGELIVSLKEMELGALDLINPDMTPGVYACLIVSDTGVGIDKKLTAKIFDPFFTTKAIGKGTGMGLSVVHGIVTTMGGAIQVYSEPEKGTQFYVYLPLADVVKEQQATNIEAPIQGGTEHILLVDDEEAICQMEKQTLEHLGYQTTSRTSSLEALEAFRTSPDRFDLIITDMTMPKMSGDKLSVELIKIRPDIPILLCTGFSENMSKEKAASLGIKGFLFKPIAMKDLAQKIREVLDK